MVRCLRSPLPKPLPVSCSPGAGTREEREQAARKLGRLKSRKAVPLIVEAGATGGITEAVAYEALDHIGQRAVPALTEALTDGRRPVRRLALEALLKIDPKRLGTRAGHLRNLFDRRVEQQAVWALGRLVDPPEEAVAALIGMLNDRSFRFTWMAARALGQMGPQAKRALPTLLRMLKEGRLEGHEALALAEISIDDPERVLSALLEALNRPGLKKTARQRTVEAIGIVGGAATRSVPTLVEFLGTGDSILERNVLLALRRMGPTSKAVRAALEPVLRRSPCRTSPNDAAALAAQFGADVIPLLVKLLASEDKNARGNALKAVSFIGGRAKAAVPALTKLMHSPDSMEWRWAVQALGSIGPAASAAVPRLVARMLEHEPGQWAYFCDGALGHIGPAAVPALIELLRGENASAQSTAARVIDRIGPAARDALPDLLEALSSEHTWLKQHAARALGSAIVPHLESVAWALKELGAPGITKLLPLLEDRDEHVRLGLLDSLRELGSTAAVARTHVLERLADEHFRVREYAGRALTAIGVTEKELPRLASLLVHEDRAVRETTADLVMSLEPSLAAKAAGLLVQRLARAEAPDESTLSRALGYLGPAGRHAVPVLIKRFASADASVRVKAIEALKFLGDAAKDALEPLETLLDDPEASVRLQAAETTWRISGRTDRAVGVATELLRSDDLQQRMEAVRLLAAIGPAAQEALDELVELLQVASTSPLRIMSLDAVGSIARGTKRKLPALAACVGSQDPGVSCAAVKALARIGCSGTEAVAILRTPLTAKNADLRRAAARAAATAGAEGQPLLSLLFTILRTDTEPDIRALAARAIGKIGVKTEAEIRQLAHALYEKDQGIVWAAARALAEQGTHACPAVPYLIEMMRKTETRTSALPEVQRTLVGLGDRAVDKLIAEIASPSETRHKAWLIEVLGRMGPRATKAVPHIKKYLAMQLFYSARAKEALQKIRR